MNTVEDVAAHIWETVGDEWGIVTLEAKIQRQGTIHSARLYASRAPGKEGAEFRLRTTRRDAAGWHDDLNETYPTLADAVQAFTTWCAGR